MDINGRQVTELATQVDPHRDRVRVRGEEVQRSEVMTYIAVNKPAGYITTARDEQMRPTIFELVHTPVRVFPVGRLDRDSEGLLLLTNDGDLAFRLSHPSSKLPRVYRVLLKTPLSEDQDRRFRRGVRIDEGRPALGQIRFPFPAERQICEVTIHEGRNRQVRKMFAALGCRVKGLQRVAIGPLALGRLNIGAWRYLTPREVEELKEGVGQKDGDPR